MRVLGIHDGHSAAACIYEDGRLTAGIQEERLTRVKNWSGVPEKSIATVLELAGVAMKDIDYVAVNGHHMPYPKDRGEILEEYRSTGSVQMSVKKFLRHTYLKTLYNDKRKRERLGALHAAGIPESESIGNISTGSGPPAMRAANPDCPRHSFKSRWSDRRLTPGHIASNSRIVRTPASSTRRSASP